MFLQFFSSKSSVTYSFHNWKGLLVTNSGCSFANFSISTKVMFLMKLVLFFLVVVVFWHFVEGGSRCCYNQPQIHQQVQKVYPHLQTVLEHLQCHFLDR